MGPTVRITSITTGSTIPSSFFDVVVSQEEKPSWKITWKKHFCSLPSRVRKPKFVSQTKHDKKE
jgi:hypothetical protein